MNIKRAWAMPNADTFNIKPINNLIGGIISDISNDNRDPVIVDPFVRNSVFKGNCITNDLDTGIEADYHLDAYDFLKLFDSEEADMVLFDPPYSPRQVSECYRKMDKIVNMQTTQASFWSKLKKEIRRIVKKDGVVVTCGWNSGGIGKKYGFEIGEILLVAHGGWHNDTIVTVERKVNE